MKRPIPGEHLTQPMVRWPTMTDGEIKPLNVSDLTVAGTLGVTGTATFSGTLTAQGDVNLGTGDDTLTLGQSGDTVDCDGDWGWFGATAVGQQSALTTEHADLTQAGTDNADTTIQAATNSSPYGFVNADEFEAVVATLINMKTRVAELEATLQAFGFVA